jgi:hypothetical protein
MRSLIVTIVSVASIIALCGRVSGADLDSYDLDSLVFMSEDIVRGVIGQEELAGSVFAQRLIVSASLAGTLQPNDSVQVAGTGSYRRSDEAPPGISAFAQRLIAWPWLARELQPNDSVQVAGTDSYRRSKEASAGRIKEGEEVIAFLVCAKSGFVPGIPQDQIVYMPVPSGLRVIVDGRTCGFEQHSNPGPYVMDTPTNRDRCPPVEEFEKQCAESIARIRPLVDRLNRKATEADPRWLLDVLESRAAVPVGLPNRRDAIAEAACIHLAETKNLPMLDEALFLSKTRWGSSELARGFDSAEGRQYLLQKLADPQVTRSGRRQTYAMAIKSSAWDYFRLAQPDEKFLERQALLAVDFAGQGDVSTAKILIGHIRAAANLDEQAAPQGVPMSASFERDLVAALNLLKGMNERIASPELRFEIDQVMLQARPELGFKCAVGPVTSLLTITGIAQGYRPGQGGHVVLEYSYACSRELGNTDVDGEIVLQDAKTHQTFVVGKERKIVGGGGGGAGATFALPADLPRAHYRIFLRLKQAGIVLSDGHGAEADLPADVD